jgi:tol-pal system protein YbgF
MNIKIFIFIFALIYTNTIILMSAYAQDSSEKKNSINEKILNKIEGLNTKINDLERKVYQGKDKVLSNTSTKLNKEEGALSLEAIAGHERRLLVLEEKARSLEGLIEEINNYVRIQIKKLTTQNSLLEEKLDLINNQKLSIAENKNEGENIQDELVEEYPIYPGMANKKSSIEKDELNILNDAKNNTTVEVLAKIDPGSGNDEIIKENVTLQENTIETGPMEEIANIKKNNSIVSISKNPVEIYQRAYNILSKGNYEAAEAAFNAFIKDYPAHNLTSNAYYWLGQTFFVRKNYQKAATTFAEGYIKLPTGSKAADQLFKLGISLNSLNKNTDACATFKKLGKEFPDAPSRISNRAKTFKEKLDCK